MSNETQKTKRLYKDEFIDRTRKRILKKYGTMHKIDYRTI